MKAWCNSKPCIFLDYLKFKAKSPKLLKGKWLNRTVSDVCVFTPVPVFIFEVMVRRVYAFHADGAIQYRTKGVLLFM